MIKIYNPADWYWQVPNGFFSSKTGATVTNTDSNYATFVASGGVASVCPDATGTSTVAAVTTMLQAIGVSVPGSTSQSTK